jgi:phosphohistidine swiveling domain-containing protein
MAGAMSRYILRGAEALASPRAGGKARALADVEGGGLPVPPWFVLSAEACEQALAAAGSADRLGVEGEVLAELRAAVSALSPAGELLAVRSSASDEDGPAHSFAGQLESYLNVSAADVPARVADVWRSAFTERILAYRREHGLSPSPRPPAVLVQRMLAPRAAGVAFSADPVSGRRGIAVVSAAHGLGSAVVSGEADADTWLVGRDAAVVERRIVPKRTMHVADASNPDGVRTATVPEPLVNAPALSDAEATQVAGLARAAARHFGRPQDIEWAFAGTLYLLQSRPITSLGALPDPDGHLTVWDNSNIVESYSGITTPLTFSFAREIYQHVYEQFCRMMGVPDRVIANHDATFRNMLGLVRGRLYYNLLNWYRMLALLPGYSVNRAFMEQMMGVKEALPEELAQELAATARRGRVLDSLYLARTLGGLLVNHFTIDRRVDAFYRRLDVALRPPVPPLEEQRPDELVAHYRDLRGRLLLAWDAPLVNDFFAMIFYGVLRSLSAKWVDPQGTIQNDLISGEGGIVSAEPAVRLQRMARIAAGESDEVAGTLVEGAPEEAVAAIDAHPALGAEFRAYLEKFGERTVNELKLESETLVDDPIPLVRAIGTLARQVRVDPAHAAASSGDRLRAGALRRVDEALGGHPLRRLVFGWVLRHARRRVRDRENLRLERTRLFGRIRRIYLELGRRFHGVGLLDDPRDIFYLEVDEALAFVEGRATTTDLRGLAGVRRAEYRAFDTMPAPDDRFETRGMVNHGHAFTRRVAREPESGDERRGLGCCPGIVRGAVRVVRDPRTANIRERAILVAEHTDPGWIMIFPSASALVVERGSLLSHAAIVARELGIPAVVSVAGATRWLADGDEVEVDGSEGTVRRIPPKPGVGA